MRDFILINSKIAVKRVFVKTNFEGAQLRI